MGINITTDNNSITLINLYDKDNPMLEIGDTCYFIFFNSIDYHIPLIGQGIVLYDRFNDVINKHYFIQLQKLVDDKKIIDKFIENKQIQFYPFSQTNLHISTKPKIHKYNEKLEDSFFEDNLMKIECFFIRKTLKDIQELRKNFIDIVNQDINKQLLELQELQELT